MSSWYEDEKKIRTLINGLVNEWYEMERKTEREWDGEDLLKSRYNNKGERIGLTIVPKEKLRVKAE